MPEWGKTNCLRFGASNTGNIRGKGGVYHNLCLLQGDERDWPWDDTNIVLKPCNNRQIIFE
jgi:hypothetical protein